MKSKILQTVLLVGATGLAVSLWSCGATDKGKMGRKDFFGNKESNDGEQANNNGGKGPNSGDGSVDSQGGSDLGSAADDVANSNTSLRLLKPYELDAKTQDVFGTPWMVTITQPVEGNPNGTVSLNGFEAYAGNLNGIDYNFNNSYSVVGSAIYISTHEKFCNELSEKVFADATLKGRFFVSAKETDTLATNAAGIEKNILDIMSKMYGKSYDSASAEFQKALALYKDLEAQTAVARNNKHTLQFTVSALCFTDRFVHLN